MTIISKNAYLKGLSEKGVLKLYEALKRHNRPLKEDEIESLMGEEAHFYEAAWNLTFEDVESELDDRKISY